MTLDVGAPVYPPPSPGRDLALWGPADAIGIARIDEAARDRRHLLHIGAVRRFFLDRVVWSPDGRRLAFTGEPGSGDRQINVWAVGGDGGGCAE